MTNEHFLNHTFENYIVTNEHFLNHTFENYIVTKTEPHPTPFFFFSFFFFNCTFKNVIVTNKHIVQELCESRGGRSGLSVLTSLLVSVDVKIY